MPELDPPVVVLSDSLEFDRVPVLTERAVHLAGQAIGVLRDLPVFGSPSDRDDGLCAAIVLLEKLAPTFATQGVPVGDVEAKSLVQQYFRLRTADIGGEQAAVAAVGILTRSLVDLRSAPVSGSSMSREIAGICQVLVDISGSDASPTLPECAPSKYETSVVNSRQWYYRWIVAHQLHALFNLFAAAAVGAAIRSLAESDSSGVCASLRRATVYVEGFSSARAHALAIPSWYYNDVLRPSMAPPLSAAPLSGGMHLEYKAFRTQVSRLLAETPLGIRELAEIEPEVAFAREALLEADLMDSENHVCLIEPVVRQSKSLIQNANSGSNAVGMLRRIRDRRASTFQPFVRNAVT